MAVFKVRHIIMGFFESKLWRARLVSALGPERAAGLLRGYQPGHLLIIPPGVDYDGPVLDGFKELSQGLEAISHLEDDGAGSNNWVMAGSRTDSGEPLLAGDPHRALDTPNVYYQNHIACPEFDAIGLSFPGFPGFPHFGHNAHVAWCVTHAMADCQDLYIERFRQTDAPEYQFEGQWKRAEVSHEVIEVRDGDPVEMDVAVTQHGPVIAGDPAVGYGIAFKYTATSEPNRGPESILRMLQASGADELEESMRSWVDPCKNFLYCDVHGNIGYLNRGKVPIRSMDNAWLPVPGWSGQHEWRDFIPFEELARSRNPDTGYIVTANNRIVGKDYPHYIALDYAPEYRARRILQRLKPLNRANVGDMAGIHAERVSVPAQTYCRLLAGIEAPDELSRKAQETLADWDGAMDPDAVAPTIYSAFRLRLNSVVLKHLLGPLSGEAFDTTGRGAPGHLNQLSAVLATMALANDASLLPPGCDWKSLLKRALADGVSDLRDRLGDDMDTWQWGTVHYTRPRHTLSNSFPELAPLLDPPSGVVPMGGDGDTPQAGSYAPWEPFVMTSMSVSRYVFDAGDWNNSAWVGPLGASGHPGSPHYADQAPIWSQLELVPMLYDWDRVTSTAESRQTLKPG